MTILDQIRKCSIVVADTGDLEQIKRFSPEDATTNPSLILKAIQSGKYDKQVNEALTWATSRSTDGSDMVSNAADRLIVLLGYEISQEVPGYVSTEVNATLSFDTEKTVEKALFLIDQYKDVGLDKSKVLIKIAATWEGIQAAKILEAQGIRCNLTLVFNFTQALACAQNGAYLISPFVGRILDWYQTNTSVELSSPADEPGVQSVRDIHNHFKKHHYKTIIMGASFRNIDEILYLSGCDRLTISPNLLEELANKNEITNFFPAISRDYHPTLYSNDQVTETKFRWDINEDPMSTQKLAEGIRVFTKDQRALEQLLLNWSK